MLRRTIGYVVSYLERPSLTPLLLVDALLRSSCMVSSVSGAAQGAVPRENTFDCGDSEKGQVPIRR
jgi:hypothetical protein